MKSLQQMTRKGRTGIILLIQACALVIASSAAIIIVPARAAQVAPSKVLVQWNPDAATIPTDPGSYAVQRAISVNGVIGNYAQVASNITGLSFTDTQVTAGTTYAYTVTFTYTAPSQSSGATSDPSIPAIVTVPGITPPPPPPPPTGTPKPPPVTGVIAKPQ